MARAHAWVMPDAGPAGSRIRSSVTFAGIAPAGEGIDVLWGGPNVYLMKEKGVVKRAWQPPDPNIGFSSVSFDGRYVWAAGLRPGKPNVLLVLDPVSERVQEFTEEDGLPLAMDGASVRPGYQALRVTGVEPGRACVVGGRGTMWLAIVTFDPEAGKGVRVFHEARAQRDPRDPEHWKSPNLAFGPGLFVTLSEPAAAPPAGEDAKPAPPTTAPAKPARRVLLGRGLASLEMRMHPLLIDPDAMTVRALDGETVPPSVFEYTVAVHDGSLFWLEPGPSAKEGPRGPHLWRIGFPDFEKTLVIDHAVPEHVPDGREPFSFDKVAFDGDRVIVAARQWWLAPAAGEPFRRLSGDPPDRSDPRQPAAIRAYAPPPPPPGLPPQPPIKSETVVAVRPSAHYGLVVITSTNTGQGFYRARVQDRPTATTAPAKD